MNAAELEQAIAATVEATRSTITPTARKTGRDHRFPYVPILAYASPQDGGRPYTTQIRGLAYAAREEAIDRARRCIDAQMALLANQLREPHYRALREHHGLPRELPS